MRFFFIVHRFARSIRELWSIHLFFSFRILYWFLCEQRFFFAILRFYRSLRKMWSIHLFFSFLILYRFLNGLLCIAVA
ncbi:hypothetical protein AAVH_18285 [Aphelenchoides avenae]|nr:hypothetical protein AAVH_18285 [Aphelenchus avenae]